ncbi:MAG: SdrD B-like domain-containing protein, partial [Bacteroidia bacterium]
PGADPEAVPVDNDDNGTTGTGINGGFIVSLPITLTPGAEVQNNAANGTSSNDYLDFGMYQPLAVGNFVWLDDDGLRTLASTSANGFADPGEAPIDGVTLSIYLDANGDGIPDNPLSPVQRDTTSNGGFYIFQFLSENNYVIVVDPANFQPGGVLFGLVSTDPSEVAPDGGLDQNDNGLQNANYPVNGTRTSSLHLVVGGAPTGESPALAGATSVPDSSAYLNVDFGFVGPGAFGNLVWDDLDGNGLQSAAEPGIPGVFVTLYLYDPVSQTSTQVGTQYTDADGKYLFDNLLPNRQYYVRFDSLPANYGFSPKDIGGNTANNDSIDSDAHPVSGLTIPTLISPNEQDTSWDAGLYFQSAVIGDFVWIDSNRNGVQDPGEQGLPGVTVYLFQNGMYIDTMVTDANGRYRFRNLVPGNYRIVFDLNSLPPNYIATTPNVGVTDASDSDANVSNGFTDVINLSPNEVDLDWDLGVYIPVGSIGDFVWLDYVQNRIQDPGEPGLPGVTVYLYDGSGNLLDSTVTDAAGAYLFDELLPGDYYVQFDLGTIPYGHAVVAPDAGSNDGLDSDADPVTGQSPVITLAAGQHNHSLDMGVKRIPAALGGLVWDDLNRDGIQDPGEVGVPNVIVYLLDASNNVVKVDTTDANGAYFFNGLNQGSYQVYFDQLPATYVVSPQNQGANDTIDSDANVATRVTQLITLQLSDTSLYWDMGIYRPGATLGNYVWEDANGNGIQDAGESPIGGAWVYLLDNNGTRIDLANNRRWWIPLPAFFQEVMVLRLFLLPATPLRAPTLAAMMRWTRILTQQRVDHKP